MVQCDNSVTNPIPPTQMDCALGSLTPSTVSCSFTASRKSRDDDKRMNFIIDDGNFTSSAEEDVCGAPARELAMLIYKNEDQGEADEVYPSGSEISFACIPSVTGERTTWKIICENGQWIGRAHDCGKIKKILFNLT